MDDIVDRVGPNRALVIFGASGDLTARKLLPALEQRLLGAKIGTGPEPGQKYGHAAPQQGTYPAALFSLYTFPGLKIFEVGKRDCTTLSTPEQVPSHQREERYQQKEPGRICKVY